MPRVVLVSVLAMHAAFGQVALTTAQIARKVSPSVVVIQGKADSGEVLGSGFIVSNDGKIVTNLHVIRDLKTASVQLADGRVSNSPSVLAIDELRDLAVLQIAGFGLPAVDLGNSDALTVGEPLVVVGSPRGLGGTVTAGILSSVRDSGDGYKVLQTDAAVNPGNSGGPLLNGNGQAIGVIAFKLRSSEGLNFAIPINYVYGLINTRHEPVSLDQMRRSLGGTTLTSSEPSLRDTLGWLKENLPRGWIHSQVRRPFGLMRGVALVSIVERPTVSSLDSCTAVFGREIVQAFVDPPNDPLPKAMVQYTVHLPAITDGGTVKTENVPSELYLSDIPSIDGEFVGGDKWNYRVLLGTRSKNIRVTTTTFNYLGVANEETSDAELLYLDFNDETLARGVEEAFLRAASICRSSTVTTAPTKAPKDNGPTLRETLDWLKEKIPVGAIEFATGDAYRFLTIDQGAVWSLESCTAVLGHVETISGAAQPGTVTRRYTIPLASLTANFVDQRKNLEEYGGATPLRSQSLGYRVILKSKSKDISLTVSGSGLGIQYPPRMLSTDWLDLNFSDESLAQRVLQAFNHAAELCRGREPF